ncbi:hypothetical protein GBA52_012277 [Prunus armeniaca]|nr:hypothetical protein GBA52_012277 [Prunus armeniaca]
MGFGSWWPKSAKHWLEHMGVLSVVVKFPYICEEDVQKEMPNYQFFLRLRRCIGETPCCLGNRCL